MGPAPRRSLLLSSNLLAALLALPATAIPPEAPCALGLPALYERVSPAVVSISAAAINPYDSAHPIDRRSGSGVIVDPQGLILTNAHVVAGPSLLTVTLDDGASFPARIVGSDAVFDIAFIRIPRPSSPLPAAKLGDSDAVRVGDEVYAIGNPFGLEQTLTRGIVSAVNRILPGATWSMKEPLIQTDAAINPGNSGGPLVNPCGDVVGLTTAIIPDAQSIGFAVPSALVKAVAQDLLEKGHVARPWLGIQGTIVSRDLRELLKAPLGEGLLVEVVEPASPAGQAGVKGGDLDLVIAGHPLLVGGDVLTAIDGTSVGTTAAAGAALAGLTVGSRVTLTLSREGRMRTVDVTVGERPDPRPEDTDGFMGPLAARPVASRRSRFAPEGRLSF